MKHENVGLNGRSNHIERSEQPNENIDELINSLRNLAGPEFIERLKQIKKANPDFTTSLENIELKDRFGKDVLEASHFLDRDGSNEEWVKTLEKYYYPEHLRNGRRYNRRMFGIAAGALGILGTGAAIGIHEVNERSEKDKGEEKQWEALKISISEEELEQQIDTVFDSLKGNRYRHLAYDTLEKTIEYRLEKEEANLEKASIEKINNYLDSTTTEDPKGFKNLILEYWKDKNKLPNNYYQIAYRKDGIGGFIFNQKVEFDREYGELDAKRNDFRDRLRKAFLRTFDSKTADYVEEAKRVEEKKTEPEKAKEADNEESPELKDFRARIHDLLRKTEASQKLDSVLSEKSVVDLSHEISDLENKLNQLRYKIDTDEQEAKRKIESQKREEILKIKAKSDSLEISAELNESLPQEVWDYLKEYYLNGELWRDYSISDPDSKNKLEKLKQDPKVLEALKKLTDKYSEIKTSTDSEVELVNNHYNNEEKLALKEIRDRINAEIREIEQNLLDKKTKYDAFTNNPTDAFLKEADKIWKEERKKLGNPSTIPVEPSY